jgi:Tetratricopeptide repeat
MYERSARLACDAGDDYLAMIPAGNLACLAASQGDYERAIALSQDCLELCERLGDRYQMSLTECNLAVCTIRLDRLPDAIGHVSEAARHSQSVGDSWSAVLCVEIAAATLTLTGETIPAARLFACAETRRAAIGRALEAPERDVIHAALATIHTHLHHLPIAAAWAQGTTLNLDHAIHQLTTPTPHTTPTPSLP